MNYSIDIAQVKYTVLHGFVLVDIILRLYTIYDNMSRFVRRLL